MKSLNENSNWEKVKNKNYSHYFPLKTPWQDWSTHQYYSCDSTSSLSVYFSNKPSFALWGPPLIPFLPAIPIFDYARFKKDNNTLDLTIRINIQTLNYDEIDSLIKHIHFYFNDSLNLLPSNTKIINNKQYRDSQYDGIFCNKSNINKYYSIFFIFKKASFKLKKLIIDFDEKFNHILNSNYKTLSLKRKNKFYYCPFCDNPWF